METTATAALNKMAAEQHHQHYTTMIVNDSKSRHKHKEREQEQRQEEKKFEKHLKLREKRVRARISTKKLKHTSTRTIPSTRKWQGQ